ncbi:hypothetical protein [uncultured Senegalimassilia sp.]|uniref:hypothetical protein n=1 Tax=uncultured Senegalimassilia sp. TaxID=1714350 RepID=UPI002675B5E3|nr:hypothetical protein [uncultured Senegalimassilia sp.]
MNSEPIYKEFLLGEGLSELKKIRDGWRDESGYSESRGGTSLIPENLCNVSGSERLNYTFIMDRANECMYRLICESISMLLTEYGYITLRARVRRSDAYQYLPKDGLAGPTVLKASKRVVRIIKVDVDGSPSVFVFKEPGLDQSLPKELENSLRENFGVSKITYVSLVMDGAKREVLNYESVKDATPYISVKEFFRLFFPQEEFDKFEEAVVELRQKARSYYGLSITKSLNHLRMGHFRRDIRDRLIGYKPDVELGSEQRMAIDKSFVVDGRYSALTGDTDFAVSFQTAEWLRDSLAHAGCIDFAPIALEYFKSLEQFLYRFLYAIHKTSKSKSRRIYYGKKPGENPYYLPAKRDGVPDKSRHIEVKDGEIEINEELFADGFEYVLDLGRLTRFFGDYVCEKQQLYCRNEDLLDTPISKNTYESIIRALQSARTMRNGIAHKDNLHDWIEMESARSSVLLAFYLVLGSYSIDAEMRSLLGIENDCVQKSEEWKLCNYVASASVPKGNPFEIPVFYLDGDHSPESALFACPDDGESDPDRYGKAQSFSGVYFKRIGSRERYDVSYPTDRLPSLVEQGTLVICSEVLKLELTGPQKVIYRDGNYLGDTNEG